MSEKINCAHCDGEYDSDDMRDMTGVGDVCYECSVYCESCESLILTDESYSVNHGDAIACEDCYWSCDSCEDRYMNDVSSYTVNAYGAEEWCQGCLEANAWYCDGCSESYSERHDNYSVDGDTWCDSCLDSDGWVCEDCDEAHSNDTECDCGNTSSGIGLGSGNRCRCGTSSPIHNYSCKPQLVFHGISKHKVYMGFELETQIRKREMNALGNAARYANEQLSPDSIAILKEDASIGREGYSGFEIVTQPHTLDQYRFNSGKLWDTIEKLRTDYDARSWDTTTCGLHVHVSRAGFSGGAHTHRWLTLIYKNAEHMMKLAGRKSSYARFNDVWTFDEYDRPVFSLAHKVAKPNRASTERYSAVNTQNEHTLELRFFRGTMNKSGVLSALDLVQASVEYTRNLSLSDVKMGALGWDWFVDYVEQNNGLYPDLYSRLPRLSSVDINRPATMNA